MTLWTLENLAAATNGRIEGKPAQNLTGISIDSRTIQTGEVYIAIKGDVHDGHDFVEKALANSAGVAIVSSEWAKDKTGNFLVVENPFTALQDIARASRARTKAKIIAVTGSVGKTSTKEALKVVFESFGRTHAAVASFNNHWGVPLTLARMPQETDYGIFEIGMSNAGEITPLVKMVSPHVAIITNVYPVHLAQFNSVEEIADAKAEIFDGLLAGGTAILNKDNPHFERLAAKAKAFNSLTFGKSNADITFNKCENPLEVSILGETVRYNFPLAGEHLALNSLAVLGAVKALGLNIYTAASALETLKAVKGRGERHTLAQNLTLIDESYNANPASMRAAIGVLAQESGRKIAVLGDMLELGHEAQAMHTALTPDLEAIDLVFCCGSLMQGLYHALPVQKRGYYAATSTLLLPHLKTALKSNDTLMVKGSLGSKMAVIIDGLKNI